MSYKCHYCLRQCSLVAFGKDDQIIKYKCEPCHAWYHTNRNSDELIYIIWSPIRIGESCFMIKIYSANTGNAPEFVVEYIPPRETGKMFWEEIIRWNFIPNWTPQNAAEKLKTCLTFL